MATTGRVQRPGAQEWVPPAADVDDLRAAAPACRGCELWEPATQVVFSAGPSDARLVLVGEQPGDREDREGEPFVGPAGRVLSDALVSAGIPRGDVYVTNAVKHFRFEERGPRRLHKSPAVTHIRACLPWLSAELAVVRPQVVVCLGVTAAKAVVGEAATLGALRGRILGDDEVGTGLGAGRRVLITAHPSSILRLQDPAERRAATGALVEDLCIAAAEA
ncbi:UdgX family uracil-DNA binding protein [Cellulomonas marina]|uniref:Type-4 uracil-DNA glycosylase n=1 Tax=Cellulomonas marina TaxID=988821 RepID=A0A1I1ANA3_9CELL|nr:UdgX family uracil-DNA binding protein [Cellulomonas marina]GIG30129.1 hypothetical protein Cma02nite_27290 [Cellulomonas marina]SFB37938.1 DNA polymerase [Cellulomonas marina]